MPPPMVDTGTYTGPDRREPNGRDWTSLRAWANAIGVVGIPGAIAIFLVYMGATQIPALVSRIDQLIVEVRQNRDLLQDHAIRDAQMIRLAQRACSNSAKDDNARQACFDP